MKPEGVLRVVKKHMQVSKPLLLAGAPGVGKTDICKNAAADTGYDLVITHPVVEDPTDAKGLPWVSEDKKSAVFLPFGQLFKLLNATKPTLWLIDDVGQASPATQAANMQWLLAREVNGHRLPDCVTIVAATNRKQDRAGVQGLLEPVKSRFLTILTVEPDLNQWCYWALKNGVPPMVVAFLRFKHSENESRLLVHAPTSEMTNSPSPRTWANLGEELKMDHDVEDQQEVFGGSVGKAYGDEFFAFLRLFKEIPNPDAVLLNPNAAAIPAKPDVLWALASALVSRVNAANFGRFATYADRLMKAGNGEFAALMLRGALGTCPDVQFTPEFTQIATTNSALLFSDI
jgi:MoxR-like ATPase